MADARNLWLHIGSEKTGSSSLQTYLLRNRAVFEKKGLRYVTPAPKMQEANRLAVTLGNGRTREAANICAEIFKTAQFEDMRDVVVSSEMLFRIPAAAKLSSIIREHINEADISLKIVCYIRRQDRYLESLYAQRAKTGSFVGGLEDYVAIQKAARGVNYNDIIQSWKDAFPEARMIVRRYEKDHLVSGDVAADFLSLIGHENLYSAEGRSFGNKAPHADALAVMSQLARFKSYRAREIYRRLHKLGIPDTGATRVMLPYDLRCQIMNDCADGNEAIRKEYFGDSADLFDMSDLKVPYETEPAITFTEEQLELLQKVFRVIHELQLNALRNR
ncbi:hypothetical protein [Paracoccus onubensis]|uniref:Sulfotransferase domain-containing protein n=1 Tax=Paracoccus onubensis TaxID=1675788 RepID=A0A418SU97_9RHOB|nr:hypothetical protein [Paracoccus onubensis]RJE84515.1 hypothetical protein D3P04_12765 [Paracoccus onubensis]